MTYDKYPPRGYFVCECDSINCFEHIAITPQEREALPKDSLIISDHCCRPPRLKVLEVRDGYRVLRVKRT